MGVSVGLFSLDQEKAFDCVEYSFLWKTMERFGFNTGLLVKIQVLYSGIEGSLCAPFKAHRGVQQGFALSRMLYALSLEPLLDKLHLCVQGLVLPGFNSNVDQCDVDVDY